MRFEGFSSLVELLAARALELPDKRLYAFLSDGEREEASLTYSELDRKARASAARLAEVAAPGERALLLYPAGLDFIIAFFACLYAGVVAVPAVPPSSRRALPRLRSIARDAEPAVALTTRALGERLRRQTERLPELAELPWLATDEADETPPGWRPPPVGSETLAFLQYTSGSTADPKGVMITHANLLHNEEMIRQGFGQSPDTVVVGWLPLYHDMGLIGNVLQPLYAGGSCVLMSPVAFLQKPLRWLQAIHRYRASTSGGPDFAYDLCVHRIGEAERRQLDLSCWRVAFNGAEPVRASTLERFATAFAPAGFDRRAFYPCYGLAEATLFVTGGSPEAAPLCESFSTSALEDHRAEPAATSAGRNLVSSGPPRGDQEVLVVDAQSRRRLAAGEIGEIWIAGASVASGYWRRPQATAREFGARLEDEPGAGPYLRTGDLGFLHSGELFVTGRLKELIILRGRNHYPQDLEATAEGSHPSLRPGGSAAFTVGEEERLVVAAEVERRALRSLQEAGVAEGVIDVVRQAVAEVHEVAVDAVVLMRPGALPKTSSGKKRRLACHAAYLAGSLPAVARSELERTGADAPAPMELDRGDLLALPEGDRRPLLADHLGRRLQAIARLSEPPPEEASLAAAGLDSLGAAELASVLAEELAVTVEVSDLLAGATLAQLTDGLLRELGEPPEEEPPPRHGEEGGEHPLSWGQRAMWFLQQLAPRSAAYNIAVAARIEGDLDAASLHRAFRHLVARHAALRTIFPAPAGEPVARIAEPGQLEPEWTEGDAADWSETRLAAHFADVAERPFDLEHGPLVRLDLRRLGEGRHALLWTVHHAVADFWSLALAAGELGELYLAERGGRPPRLDEPELAYDDYARWQAALLESERGQRLEAYWRQELAPPLASLELPTDRPRPPVASYRGGAVEHLLSPELGERLRELGRRGGATLFMTLLAIFQTLLGRLGGQRQVLVGSPTAGRERRWQAGIVGYLVNPVVLRGELADDPPFATLLSRARRASLDGLRHRDMPFDLLVERLRPERDPSRSPIFQAMLTLQEMPRADARDLGAFALGREGGRLEIGGLVWRSMALETRAAAFDLSLVAAPTRDGLGLALTFNRDLYDVATASRLLRHFEALAEAACDAPSDALSELRLLSAAERHQLLREANDADAAFDREASLHQLVLDRARRSPEAVAAALVTARGPAEQLSYGELARRTLGVADALRRLGVGAEALVPVCAGRRLELLPVLLGVNAAGGAYVPLDPDYPAERLRFMLDDVLGSRSAGLVLCDARRRSELAPLTGAGTRLVELAELLARPQAGAEPSPGGERLAYVIYTSGSTGRPKGVQVHHSAVVNFLRSMARRPGIGAEDRLLAVTTLAFDIAVLELFLPLAAGARVLLATRELATDAPALARALDMAGATVLQATPATWRMLLESGWEGRRELAILSGGEALPGELAERLATRGRALWNLYGPTETTVWSAASRVADAARPIALGDPVANHGLYVLDRRLEPRPLGALGEVWIGGSGLARGYLGRPALTAERFVPDPFAGLPGSRLYRVGDLGRRLANGAIAFLGRIDHQVKLRGYRIELGEIEAALAGCEGVAQAVALVREDRPGDRRLVGYWLADEEAPETGENALRAHLRRSLPEYMVPQALVRLEAFPLTPNGKVDRSALPPLRPVAAAAETASDADSTPEGELERTIAEVWREVLGVESVGRDANFFDLGGHSLLMASVHRRLSERLKRDDFGMVDLFRFPTVQALARHLGGEDGLDRERRTALQSQRAAAPSPAGAVAVIGLAGRFPGAESPEAFWRNLRAGVESITFFSPEELRETVGEAALADSDYVRARGVVDGADLFDAEFFGYSPREAETIDPQQRMFLEGAWEALEDAGYDPARYRGRVGVYAAAGLNTYLLRAGEALMTAAAGDYQAFINNDKDFLPTRVSYKLDLRGPSVNVQTACSSSLVAVHLACQSLLRGEADMALAGGISVRFPQRAGHLYRQGGILSRDGHCRAFDADASGTVLGNGFGIVVLKPLEKALADGDRIRAVVRGTAINNDGAAKVGYTAPSVDGQAAAIREALRSAGVEPGSVGYVEAHGTGTQLGDPIEVEALQQVLGDDENGEDGRRCALGSVKTNVGHLDTAAGVAGLIKTVLALDHREIPPSLHFERPNPKLGLDRGPLYVAAELTPWEAPPETPRRAGVSSFGIGGTNAHAVLEEAPAPPPSGPSRAHQLLLLSARTPTALDAAGRRLAERLRQLDAGGGEEGGALADVAYTLQVGRRVFLHRRALVASDAAEAAEALESADPERVRTAAADDDAARRVVFLFPGQGAQYPGMGAGLYRDEAVYRAEVDRCCEILEPLLGRDLRQLLHPPEAELERAERRLAETHLTQPALFVVEYALARLWMSWGLRPAAMIGHSVGELVAACLAGVFPLEDALALVALRGRLMQSMPRGRMLAVELEAAELEAHLDDVPGVEVAALNGPAEVTVAGSGDAIETLAERLGASGVRFRHLRTSHAFHSAMMEPAARAFAAEVARRSPRAPAIPYISNVSGEWIRAAEATDPDYWGRQLRRPVRFSDGVTRLLREPAVALEVGPGRSLSTLARRQARERVFVTSLRHPREPDDDGAFLLGALGRLWTVGVEIDWQGFSAGERRRRVPLPTYPFERRRYWLEAGGEARPAVAAVSPARRAEAAEWFYAPVWKSVPHAPSDVSIEGRWLVLAAPGGPGERLARRLRAAGAEVAVAAPGDGFEARRGGVFTVEPGRREDYRELHAALGGPPEHVVHAWLLDVDAAAPLEERVGAARRLGLESLMALAPALAASRDGAGNGTGDGARIRLSVLTDRLYRVTGGERLRPEGALAAGLLGVVEQEHPELACRGLDLELPAAGEETLLEELVEEILDELADEGADPRLEVRRAGAEVALRSGTRWRRDFEPLRLDPVDGAPALPAGAAVLVTGGLGGVGLALAEALASSVEGCRLVLSGRTALPEREEWDAWLAARGVADATSRRIAAVRRLEDLGAEVLTVAADAADPEAMGEALERARQRFGPLRGVIHAAGVAGGGLLAGRSSEEVEAVLRPKVEGAAMVHRLTASEPLDFFLLCSSLNALVGGFGQGDYAAANAFLDAFAHSLRRRRGGPLVAALDWDRWQGIGMAAAAPRASAAAPPPEVAAYLAAVDARSRAEAGADEAANGGAAPSRHPLLGAPILRGEREVYRAVFRPEEHWVLSEHRIAGRPTVPGATYLEMARAAAAAGGGGTGPLDLGPVVFLQPLAVEEGAAREVLTVLEPAEAEGARAFRVLSRPLGGDRWDEHARGRLRPGASRNGEVERLDPEAIAGRCDEVLHAGENGSSRPESDFLVTGRRWHGLRTIHVGQDELLAELELAPELEADLEQLALHPALLDIATGYPRLLREGNFLPLTYEHLRLRGPLPARLWSWVRMRSDGEGETLSCDVTLLSEEGEPRAVIEGFSMKRLGVEAVAQLGDGRDVADDEPRSPADEVLAGSLSAADGGEALRRVLARRVPPQLVISPRPLAAVAESYRRLDAGRVEAAAAGGGELQVHERPTLDTAYVAPASELESRVATIWQRLLGIEQVGIHDNFFELGGTSLLAVQVVSELKSELGREIPTVSIFEAPTVAALARSLAPSESEEPAFARTRSRASQKKAALDRQRRRGRRRAPRSRKHA